MYDLVIIGSGPAGLTAAIYASRACLNAVVVEKSGVAGGQILSTYEIDNYPGYKGISGIELGNKFKEHAEELGCVFVCDEIKAIEEEGDLYRIVGEQDSYTAKGVIIATGAKNALLNVPGEESLLGMGVSYCATCDGAFFAEKDVCVVGGGDVAVEDAIFLSRSCNKVYLIHRRDELRASKALQNKMKAIPNIIPLWNCKVKSINGEDCVETVTIVNNINNVEHNLKVSAVFVAVGRKPETEYIMETINTDDNGYIIATEDTRTNIERIYAVGDVRAKSLKQVVTACADGANAINSFQIDIM